MTSIHISGGIPLSGKVKVQGSKNAVLPILTATLLTTGETYIRNCPKIADVFSMLELLEKLGCQVTWQGDGVRVLPCSPTSTDLTQYTDHVRTMRSSLYLLGALLAKSGSVSMEYPGGCIIGRRPIDLHMGALMKMGTTFCERGPQSFEARAEHLHGAEIQFPKISMGATVNVILAAMLADGITVIDGASQEPEVIQLCLYLTKCGADITGIGTKQLKITGLKRLTGCEFTIPGDRIVAGTYLFAALGCGGSILLENAPVEEMHSTLSVIRDMGGVLEMEQNGIFIQSLERPQCIPYLRTESFPGFPTDLQSVALAVLTTGQGETTLEETIFEDRFRIVPSLRSMGANIEVLHAKKVHVKGVKELCGRDMEALELRGGAALVIAGLMARGESHIRGVEYISRGYENICRDFRELGARINIE